MRPVVLEAAPEVVPQPSPWACLRADAGRYFRYAGAERWLERLRIVAQTEGIWALAAYRAGQWLRHDAPAPVRLALKLPFTVAQQALRLAIGIYIDPAAQVGPGLYIGHSGGIWIAPGAVLGRDCNLSQGVTIGIGGSVRRGTPRLGDRVWVGPKATLSGPIRVGPKATLSGPIRVGSGAVIGANSLAVTNVPERGVAVGIPARVVALSGSGALIG